MNWERVERFAIESAEGYRILAQCMSGDWCYSVWGPSEKVSEINGRRYFRGFDYRARYQIGDRLPPAYSYRGMSGRLSLGYFHASAYTGTDEALAAAKAACEEDFEMQQTETGQSYD